jgi:hypothetical protein
MLGPRLQHPEHEDAKGSETLATVRDTAVLLSTESPSSRFICFLSLVVRMKFVQLAIVSHDDSNVLRRA